LSALIPDFDAVSIQAEIIGRFRTKKKPGFLSPTDTARRCGRPFLRKEEGETLATKFDRMVIYSLFLMLEEAPFSFADQTIDLRGVFRSAVYWRFTLDGKVRFI
jgi:hypothetical protein